MYTLLPTASRKRLEELLVYLGKTENYSNYYQGTRVEDFKKCFDIESPWAWEYASVVLRGIEHRELPYGEGHHIVPMAYYRGVGYKNAPASRAMTASNYTVLKYSEHLYAHYCLAFASKGDFTDKMATAFQYMYYNVFRGKKKGKHEFPSAEEFERFLPKADAIRAFSKRKICAQVDAEGRTHMWEDPARAKSESAMASYRKSPQQQERRRKRAKEQYATDPEYRAKKNEISKKCRAKNPERYKAQHRKYYIEHLDELKLKGMEYRAAHKEERHEYNQKYWAENSEELKAKNRDRVKIRGDVYNANRRAKRANDPEWREMNNSRRRERRKNDTEWRKQDSERRKAKYASNPKKYNEACKKYRTEHGPELNKRRRDDYDAKVAAGYRYRKDPATGKRGWIFVGIPEENKKTTTDNKEKT